MPQTFALQLFPRPVSSLAGVFMMRWHTRMRVLIWVIQREPSLGNIAWDKTLFCFFKKWPSTRDFYTYRISNASLCISCVLDTAAKSGFLATISHKVKFSKDILLKLVITTFWCFFSNNIFLFKNRRTRLPWCSFHDLFAVLLESSIFADKHGCALWFGSSKFQPSLSKIACDKTL